MTKQPHANKKNNLCGAKTRSGKPCRNRAMANGRCRMHGGKSTGAPKKNQNSKKHGFYSKHLPDEALEIIEDMQGQSMANLIYSQIEIQYAAIIRAQGIMFVANKNDHEEFVTKKKSDDFEDEKQYEHHTAWDRHATFLNAQSRAMSEFRSLIKQFLDMAHENDERRLKLEQMQLGIDKTKAEIDKLTGSDDDQPIEILIKRKGDD